MTKKAFSFLDFLVFSVCKSLVWKKQMICIPSRIAGSLIRVAFCSTTRKRSGVRYCKALQGKVGTATQESHLSLKTCLFLTSRVEKLHVPSDLWQPWRYTKQKQSQFVRFEMLYYGIHKHKLNILHVYLHVCEQHTHLAEKLWEFSLFVLYFHVWS